MKKSPQTICDLASKDYFRGLLFELLLQEHLFIPGTAGGPIETQRKALDAERSDLFIKVYRKIMRRTMQDMPKVAQHLKIGLRSEIDQSNLLGKFVAEEKMSRLRYSLTGSFYELVKWLSGDICHSCFSDVRTKTLVFHDMGEYFARNRAYKNEGFHVNSLGDSDQCCLGDFVNGGYRKINPGKHSIFTFGLIAAELMCRQCNCIQGERIRMGYGAWEQYRQGVDTIKVPEEELSKLGKPDHLDQTSEIVDDKVVGTTQLRDWKAREINNHINTARNTGTKDVNLEIYCFECGWQCRSIVIEQIADKTSKKLTCPNKECNYAIRERHGRKICVKAKDAGWKNIRVPEN